MNGRPKYTAAPRTRPSPVARTSASEISDEILSQLVDAMSRALTSLMALGLLLPGLGCAMCASPYDYCGPTFTGNNCGDPCFINQRAGSIFDPAPVSNPGQGDYVDPLAPGDEGVIESPSDGSYEDNSDSAAPLTPQPDIAPQPETTLRPKPDRGVNVPRPAGSGHSRVANSFRR